MPELVALAGDATAPAPWRGAALELLGAIGSPAALEALLVTLETPNIEPWLHARGSRPRSEYWDVETARWTSRPVVPGPRQGG